MASSCISSCLKDVAVHLPTTSSRYARLSADQPEPGESGRFASFEERCGVGRGHPKVVDSVSCRQMYLRSYTFSRKESFSDKTKRCVGRVAESVTKKSKKKKKGTPVVVVIRRRNSTAMICLRKAGKVTCSAVMKVVRRLIMSCTTRVNTAAD
ncbi:hypothetical protein LINGRAPRIM_LOCUS1136 [Linum grandiflorum]